MTDLVADLRYSVRTLARSPWFTALAVLVVAAGIGATTAIFSLVDAVVLRPLPFREPAQLVEIWGQDDKRTGMRVPGAVLDALRAQSQTLAAIGTHDPAVAVLSTQDGALSLRGEAVSANFAEVFGVAPIAGRSFTADDGRPGAPAVMLAGFGFWRQQLGSDPNAVGRTLFLDGVPYTVVGIMPATFRTNFQADLDFWTAYAGNRSRERERDLGYEVVARVAGSATIQQARLEVEAIANGVNVPGWRDAGRRIGLVPLKDEVIGDRAAALSLLLAAVGLLLAIACANLAQLLLARSDRRLTEFATRKALGASGRELFRLALCESLLISLAGGLAGLLLAYSLVPLMLMLAPAEIPRLADAAVNGRVMAAAMIISVVSGCAFGLAPAWRLSRLSVVQAMKHSSGPASRRRIPLRSALVVTQVALAVTLLAVAGLVIQVFVTLVPSSPGFATGSRSAFVWDIRESQYPDVEDRRRRVNDLIGRLESVPGISSAAVATAIPFGDDEPRLVPVRPRHETGGINDQTPRAGLRAVSPGFFALFQIPFLRGRPFSTSDTGSGPRVAIVNRTLARTLGSPDNVIGQSVRIGTLPTAPAYEIVGVVDDARWWGTTLAPLGEIYTPLEQDRASFGFVVVDSPLDNLALTRIIRRAFHGAVPGAPLPAARQATSLQTMIDRSIAGPRFNAAMVGAFSAMATSLAVVGLFGLVAYSVAHRRRELAVRTALGARPAVLVAASMRSAMLLAVIGSALGLVASAYLRRVIEAQLYGVPGWDLPAFGGAAVMMIATAALAAYYPASRAVHADPMTALRED